MNSKRTAVAIVLTLVTVTACSTDPEEVLLVVAPSDLDRANVSVDGEPVGALAPLGPGPRWVSRVFDRWFGKNPVLDVVALVIDLQGAPAGVHTVLVQKPGFPDLRSEFSYPADLENGAVYVSVDLPPASEGDENAE